MGRKQKNKTTIETYDENIRFFTEVRDKILNGDCPQCFKSGKSVRMMNDLIQGEIAQREEYLENPPPEKKDVSVKCPVCGREKVISVDYLVYKNVDIKCPDCKSVMEKETVIW